MIRNKFKEIYTPEQEICIDESNVRWRGRLSFRQYLPNKRHPYGIKIFKVCTKRGFTWDFKVYIGRDDTRTSSVANSVVLELCSPLLDQGRILYCDNWYTSVSLATNLLAHQTHTVGTLRSNRSHNSRIVKNARLRKGETQFE